MTEDYFQSKYIELKETIATLDGAFIDPFLPAQPLVGPEEFENSVKAYCVLCHAAIEEFIEQTVLQIAVVSIESMIKDSFLMLPLVSLLITFKVKEMKEKDTELITCPERFRHCLEEVKKQFSYRVAHNHGIDIKYLKQLCYPVALDVYNDSTLMSSLCTFCAERGQYAHTAAKRVLAPEYARGYVEDCMKICENIAHKAKRLLDPDCLDTYWLPDSVLYRWLGTIHP